MTVLHALSVLTWMYFYIMYLMNVCSYLMSFCIRIATSWHCMSVATVPNVNYFCRLFMYI